MNLLITNAIKAATNADVKWSIDSKAGEVTYSLTKKIDGKSATVSIKVSSQYHAAVPGDVVAHTIVEQAIKEFGKVRADIEAKKIPVAKG
jgi:hypothetical protein